MIFSENTDREIGNAIGFGVDVAKKSAKVVVVSLIVSLILILGGIGCLIGFVINNS